MRLVFTDGSKKKVDLEPFLRGPIFEALKKKPALFQTVKVDPQLGTIVWDNGADIDPDVLIKGMNASLTAEGAASKLRKTEFNVVSEKRARYTARKKVRKKRSSQGRR